MAKRGTKKDRSNKRMVLALTVGGVVLSVVVVTAVVGYFLNKMNRY